MVTGTVEGGEGCGGVSEAAGQIEEYVGVLAGGEIEVTGRAGPESRKPLSKFCFSFYKHHFIVF